MGIENCRYDSAKIWGACASQIICKKALNQVYGLLHSTLREAALTEVTPCLPRLCFIYAYLLKGVITEVASCLLCLTF
ncbi:hypothetical protein Cal6303_4268 [Calothrix sp. PCC 6303]|nr:hypothetical protein Cal6303_4268 [Calothrix sp. PCC 6303]